MAFPHLGYRLLGIEVLQFFLERFDELPIEIASVLELYHCHLGRTRHLGGCILLPCECLLMEHRVTLGRPLLFVNDEAMSPLHVEILDSESVSAHHLVLPVLVLHLLRDLFEHVVIGLHDHIPHHVFLEGESHLLFLENIVLPQTLEREVIPYLILC